MRFCRIFINSGTNIEKSCVHQAVEKEVWSRKMDISTILKTAPFPRHAHPAGQIRKLHDFSRHADSVSEILQKYSNSIWTTIPERESCKITGISPVSLRFEAKGPKMM